MAKKCMKDRATEAAVAATDPVVKDEAVEVALPEFSVFLALLDERAFADAVTVAQVEARARRIAGYVPAIVAEARKRGWLVQETAAHAD